MDAPASVSDWGRTGDPAHLLARPLPHGQIEWGQPDYREFVCSKSTAVWLQTGGMTKVNGHPVKVQVKDEMVGGHNVVMGFWFVDDPERRL